MALTYQPFAEAPELGHLDAELKKNVSDSERIASGLIGGALAAMALSKGGATRWTLLLAGGALLQRAFTGNCQLYRSLDIDKRHPRAGVRGNRGERIEASIEIKCPASVLYRFWHGLEALPWVMRHVKSVAKTGGGRSHWKVSGPVGSTVEWNAEIIHEEEDRMIAWQTLAGASVSSAGSVWFEQIDAETTRVKVALEFDPPGGKFGAAVARLVRADPARELKEDLAQFRIFAEGELQEIASLAKRYWEAEGRPEGKAEEHWSRAEKSVRGE